MAGGFMDDVEEEETMRVISPLPSTQLDRAGRHSSRQSLDETRSSSWAPSSKVFHPPQPPPVPVLLPASRVLLGNQQVYAAAMQRPGPNVHLSPRKKRQLLKAYGETLCDELEIAVSQ